jgi:hypothetical protein
MIREGFSEEKKNLIQQVNKSFQLRHGRLLGPQIVNVIVKLFAHRHLIRSWVDIP